MHMMDQIREERLERDRREAEKAKRKREEEARPRQTQGMLLHHLNDLSNQRMFPGMEEL